jgi:predicted GNAT superfamily acetyltransferase
MSNQTFFTIRTLATYQECVAAHRVQQACWGFKEGEGLYPPMLLTVAQNGGVVLGAFDEQDKLIGYIFGYLGRAAGGPLKLCSQTMGVLPAYRQAGVATALKLAQRERALAQGLPLITWTYDPLEAASAWLNLHKLGGLVRTYKRNVYGEHMGQLNKGLPTDRFLVEWWLESAHVNERIDKSASQRAERGDWTTITQVGQRDGAPELSAYDLALDTETLWVEIPYAFQALKQADPPLARDWRAKTGLIFEHYFERGYVAVDFVAPGESKTRRFGYILRRDYTLHTSLRKTNGVV